MNHKEMFEKIANLQNTGDALKIKFLEYLDAVCLHRRAAEELADYTDTYIKVPHLYVGDFEIDG